MTILARSRVPGSAFDRLSCVEVIDAPFDEAVPDVRPDVWAIIAVRDAVTASLLERLPNLQLVANYGVGYDNIDIDACRRRGVAVSNTPGAVDTATADLVMAFMLALLRRLPDADAAARCGSWPTPVAVFAGHVSGSTLGIVGLGGVGRLVARRARAFDMRVLYTKRQRLHRTVEQELGVEFASLDELLPQLDVLTLHCPLTPETRHLIDRDRLRLMRPDACLVNTARGALVDEQALADALREGRLAGAALDVFAQEPTIPAPLLELPNVILSPHLATSTRSAREAMTSIVVENVLAVARGDPPPNRIA